MSGSVVRLLKRRVQVAVARRLVIGLDGSMVTICAFDLESRWVSWGEASVVSMYFADELPRLQALIDRYLLVDD